MNTQEQSQCTRPGGTPRYNSKPGARGILAIILSYPGTALPSPRSTLPALATRTKRRVSLQRLATTPAYG